MTNRCGVIQLPEVGNWDSKTGALFILTNMVVRPKKAQGLLGTGGVGGGG